jgi:hypothetical protein
VLSPALLVARSAVGDARLPAYNERASAGCSPHGARDWQHPAADSGAVGRLD